MNILTRNYQTNPLEVLQSPRSYTIFEMLFPFTIGTFRCSALSRECLIPGRQYRQHHGPFKVQNAEGCVPLPT